MKYASKTPVRRRCAEQGRRCSYCQQELLAQEEGWYVNGAYICADCFPRFSRSEFSAFRLNTGEGEP